MRCSESVKSAVYMHENDCSNFTAELLRPAINNCNDSQHADPAPETRDIIDAHTHTLYSHHSVCPILQYYVL